jgi:glycosyltransferase involved in cell wall biosynthesis
MAWRRPFLITKRIYPLKPSILYYSDCTFFAGCENMIANFLNDQIIQNDFSVSFAYNFSKEYQQGLNSRVTNTNFKKFPLRLLKQLNYQKPLNSSNIWSITHKTLFAFYIPLYKYFSILVNAALLFNFFRRHKVEILHINNGGYPAANSCYSAVLAGKMVGINNIIYVVNNIVLDYKHPFRWLDYPLDFIIKKWVTVFITGSEYAGERLRKVLKLDLNKQLTINNGIQKRIITEGKEEFKEKYSIPKNKLIASVVANLEKRKGHIFLFDAIRLIKKQFPENLIPLFIFEGTGPEKNNLEKFITENDLQEQVKMIDYIPDIFNLLNVSDFVILPSISSEDFPNVVIEAMSLGKPVIGTDISGIPEQIENNKTGIVVEPQNPEELRNAIIRLASDSILIQQFSLEAKKKFDALYEKSISIQKYYNLYKSIL